MNNEIRNELESIAPRLAALTGPAEVPKMPETFYHNLQVDVLREVAERMPVQSVTEKRPVWWTVFALPKRPAIAMAVALAALVIVAVLWLWPQPKAEDPFADVGTEEIYTYMVDNIHEFELDELLEVGLVTSTGLFRDVDDEELEQYLEEEIGTWSSDDVDNLF